MNAARTERIRAERAASPTTPLTDEALAEIEAGLEGVTEGPWTVDQSGYRRSTPTVMAGGYYVCTTGPYDVRGEPRGQTATHIARLNPQTVAAWIARDKAQRAEIARLKTVLSVVAWDALDGREGRDEEEK